MINSAMSFVLHQGRSFTAGLPLSQNFDDHMLLATISGPFIGHSRYLCIPQPPSTTFAQDRVMRLRATWPTPTPQSRPGRNSTASRRASSPILLLNRDRAEMIINDTCQICCRPHRQVTILQMPGTRHFARLRMPTSIEPATSRRSYTPRRLQPAHTR